MIEERELRRFNSRALMLWISIALFAPASVAVLIAKGQSVTTNSSFLSDKWSAILIAVAFGSGAAIAVLTRDPDEPRSGD